MKPPPFAYLDPTSVLEAVEALEQFGDEAKVLAGGQSLVPLLNMRLAQPAVLIDLNRIAGLSYVAPRHRDGVSGLAIGALTRQRTVEDEQRTANSEQQSPLLAEAIGWVGHPQIRNRGTVGGSIAHADPAAELPLVFRTLDGIATVQGPSGSRIIPAEAFFTYTFTPALEPDEVLTEIWLPLPRPRTGQAFVEVARRHGDFALVAAAVSLTMDADGRCAEVAIGLGGAAPVPARAPAAERMVKDNRPTLELFREVGAAAAAEMSPTADVHADATYRREVAGTLVYRAMKLAFERAGRLDA